MSGIDGSCRKAEFAANVEFAIARGISFEMPRVAQAKTRVEAPEDAAESRAMALESLLGHFRSPLIPLGRLRQLESERLV